MLRATTLPGRVPGADRPPRPPERPHWLLALQQGAGNAAVARLLARTEVEAPAEAPAPQPTPLELAQRDWPRLADIHDLFNAPSFETFVDLREAFLGTFGYPGVDLDTAYDRALAFYRRIEFVTFMGERVPVHPQLAEALLTAEAHLGGEQVPLRSLGGCNIRRNTNQPAVLSDHSYGAAIDINAETSPNTKEMKAGGRRAQLIEAITGIDPTLDAAGDPLTTEERTADEMLQEAERLQLSSDRLKAAFQDEVSLAVCAQGIAEERGEPAGDALELGPLMFAALEEQSATGAAHRALSEFVFPVVDEGEQSRVWDEALVRATVDLLVSMAKIYRQSFSRETKSGRVNPSARSPTDAQLAVHGFMSVPPELAAALSGSDAANLRWLGVQESATKDYMHFELRERPALF